MRTALLGVALALLLPAVASAHSTVVGSGGEIVYTTEDVTSANCLNLVSRAADFYFTDFKAGPPKKYCVDFGFNASGSCSPGNEVDSNGYYYDATCTKAGVNLIRIDVGAREDVVTATIDVPIQILGGDGADTITLGNPNDVIVGGTGNDTLDAGGGDDLVRDDDGDDKVTGGAGKDLLQGGPGADTYDAGDGDDDIRTRDGVKDTIVCGPGTDKVDADTLDEVAGDCEQVARTQVAASSAGSVGNDTKPPRLAVGAATMQRVGRSRKIRIAATSTEAGTLSASGRLEVSGIFIPLRANQKQLKVPGGGVELTITLTRGQQKQVLRALRKRRKVYVKLDVVATDRAGNSATKKAPRIRLKR